MEPGSGPVRRNRGRTGSIDERQQLRSSHPVLIVGRGSETAAGQAHEITSSLCGSDGPIGHAVVEQILPSLEFTCTHTLSLP